MRCSECHENAPGGVCLGPHPRFLDQNLRMPGDPKVSPPREWRISGSTEQLERLIAAGKSAYAALQPRVQAGNRWATGYAPVAQNEPLRALWRDARARREAEAATTGVTRPRGLGQ